MSEIGRAYSVLIAFFFKNEEGIKYFKEKDFLEESEYLEEDTHDWLISDPDEATSFVFIEDALEYVQDHTDVFNEIFEGTEEVEYSLVTYNLAKYIK